jgi:predicted component of type VI protein secretion system
MSLERVAMASALMVVLAGCSSGPSERVKRLQAEVDSGRQGIGARAVR